MNTLYFDWDNYLVVVVVQVWWMRLHVVVVVRRGVISMKWFGLLIVRSVRLLLDIPITGFDNNWLLSIVSRRKMLLNDPHY